MILGTFKREMKAFDWQPLEELQCSSFPFEGTSHFTTNCSVRLSSSKDDRNNQFIEPVRMPNAHFIHFHRPPTIHWLRSFLMWLSISYLEIEINCNQLPSVNKWRRVWWFSLHPLTFIGASWNRLKILIFFIELWPCSAIGNGPLHWMSAIQKLWKWVNFLTAHWSPPSKHWILID